MAVKVKTSVELKKQMHFPKLMETLVEDKTIVVAFKSMKVGMVLKGNGLYKFGDTRTDWEMRTFKDFVGVLTLENE